MRRESCGACGSAQLHSFLNLGTSPIADAYTDTAEASFTAPRYPLELAVCGYCHLVQLLEVIDSDVLFGTGYSFYTSASPPLSEYHREYAEQVIDAFPALARGFVLEIGCNDGDLLRWFRRRSRRTVGVDPAAGPVRIATEDRKLDVWRTEFSKQIAIEVTETYGEASIVIANHVLAHVADVSDVLAGIAYALVDDGVAFIEVQYLPDMLVNNAFDLVYHEHRNFFSLTSIWKAARAHGLYVVDAQLTSRQGGSLRVTLRHDTQMQRPHDRLRELRASEWWLTTRDLAAYLGVQGRVERVRTRLLNEIHKLPGVLAGYGAPAKATTLLNFCGIDGTTLDYVVDSTPAKQGRFIPGTGILIVAPTDWLERPPPDTYLLLSWNYAREIIRQSEPGFGEGCGRWLVPIPAPMML